jgi:hypothetical protein
VRRAPPALRIGLPRMRIHVEGAVPEASLMSELMTTLDGKTA